MTKQKKKIDEARIEKAVREILSAVGEDLDRDGLKDTPARVARMYGELLAGMRDDPNTHISRVTVCASTI
jgi:GTP cyclohydrolase I